MVAYANFMFCIFVVSKVNKTVFYLGGCWTKYLSGYEYTIFKFDNTPVFNTPLGM